MLQKKITNLFTLIFVFLSLLSNAQSENITIEAHIEKVESQLYDVHFTFEIEADWHLYSQFNPENASIPLKITISDTREDIMLIGFAEESQVTKEYSDQWECEEFFFKETAKVIQRIQLLDDDLSEIVLNMRGQLCNTNCIQIDEGFTFKLDEFGDPLKDKKEVTIIDDKSKVLSDNLKLDLKNEKLLFEGGEDVKEESSLFKVFLLGVVGGLLAFFTPCVFPLVPLTVSFFTKQSSNKRKGIFDAILYGIFIILIYVLLSSPFHFIDSLDPQILNTISTKVWLNLGFFIVLMFFSGSFFGFYEITLPSSWGTKMDSASGIGGIIGIFFMALTLAIVSFSCTGPILGSLLAGSLKGGAWPLTAGMTGFGLSLAFPFALFAMFPSLLNTLPKSGGWMTNLKVILGFIEVLLAFKFLSIADLIGKWDIFYREIFIFFWLVILLLFVLFLFGILKFPGNKRKIKRLAGIRILFGIAALGAFVYLAPGVMKKPIWKQTLLSGLAPPEFHSMYSRVDNCPLGLNCFHDFEKGIKYAKKVNKPVLIDFTGYGCVNCRNMEEKVWSDPAVFEMLEKVVLISLYVDDYNNKLPVNEQFDYKSPSGRKKRIDSYGGKWSTMQIENFKTTSQPYYVLTSPDLEILNRAEQNCSKTVYETWLRTGLSNFENGVNLGNDEGEGDDDEEYDDEGEGNDDEEYDDEGEGNDDEEYDDEGEGDDDEE